MGLTGKGILRDDGYGGATLNRPGRIGCATVEGGG
jgi:hypothetical protein